MDKIGLGLDSQYRPTLTEDELEVRFDLIEQLGIRELDIWVEKVPDSWLPYLRKFLATKDDQDGVQQKSAEAEGEGGTGAGAPPVIGGYSGLGQSRLMPRDTEAIEAAAAARVRQL